MLMTFIRKELYLLFKVRIIKYQEIKLRIVMLILLELMLSRHIFKLIIIKNILKDLLRWKNFRMLDLKLCLIRDLMLLIIYDLITFYFYIFCTIL